MATEVIRGNVASVARLLESGYPDPLQLQESSTTVETVLHRAAERLIYASHDPYSIETLDVSSLNWASVYTNAAGDLIEELVSGGLEPEAALGAVTIVGAPICLLRGPSQIFDPIKDEDGPKAPLSLPVKGQPAATVIDAIKIVRRREAQGERPPVALFDLEPRRAWKNRERLEWGRGDKVYALAAEVNEDTTFVNPPDLLITAGKRLFACWVPEQPMSRSEGDRAAKELIPAGARRVRRIPVPGLRWGRHVVTAEVQERAPYTLMPWTSMGSREWGRFVYRELIASMRKLEEDAASGLGLEQALTTTGRRIGPLRRWLDSKGVARLVNRAKELWPTRPDAKTILDQELRKQRRARSIPRYVQEAESVNVALHDWAKEVVGTGESKIRLTPELLDKGPEGTTREQRTRAIKRKAKDLGWTDSRSNGTWILHAPQFSSLPVPVKSNGKTVLFEFSGPPPETIASWVEERLLYALFAKKIVLEDVDVPPHLNRHAALTHLGRALTEDGWTMRRCGKRKVRVYGPPAPALRRAA